MQAIQWNITGMSCTNCALSIEKYLTQQQAENVKVNFIAGEVAFTHVAGTHSLAELEKGLRTLGYRVKHDNAHHHDESPFSGGFWFKNHLQNFCFCFVFTLPLLLVHVLGLHNSMLSKPYVQMVITIPVYIVGMRFFGVSAVKSLSKGIPNMNVLIALGATAALLYSLYGTFATVYYAMHFMFYETTATIITLVFLGNWLEEKSIATTQASLRKLAVQQKLQANVIVYDETHQEHVLQVESTDLKVGDIVLIKTGEHVPMDCKILWGEANVNEAIITGESIPVDKRGNDKLIGGSIVENGTVKAQITAVGEDTVTSHILKLVKNAQSEKPAVQLLADKISAIFVPTVTTLAVITFVGNYFFTQFLFGESLLRAVAVLVIACPCAMGLATPAAIAVGLGRAARNGVLFKNAKSLEAFKTIKQVVFDKTGTLTTGKFAIAQYKILVADISDEAFKRIVFSLEKYSMHPIAKSIVAHWQINNPMSWVSVEEIRGMGIHGKDKDGKRYTVGSAKTVQSLTTDFSHAVYLTCNDEIIGYIDVVDEIRPEAKHVIEALQRRGIKTILLSGDKRAKCEYVAKELGIDEIVWEQTPDQKLEKVALYNTIAPTAMVGDGINDAPALAKATVGISLSDASQIAIQGAAVVLVNHGIKNLPLALGLGRHTYITIKENLFWAFAYNVVAIPIAAFGFLSPTFAALVMGLSDVVLAINSIRLQFKRV